MKKLILASLFLFLGISALIGQNQYKEKVSPTKNVILMIPDGTSIGVVSAARWFQIYNKLGGDRLAIDPYICGTVKTYNSNAPIGDSAPTTSCYMTGYLSQAGNVAIYPEVDAANDIHPVNADKSLQPLATVLEAAKYDLGKSTGLVVTVQFPHATPADCSAHHYNRSKYFDLAAQQVANRLDVVIGSGNKYLTKDQEEILTSRGTKVLRDNIQSFREYDASENIWALFGEVSMPYDMDRNDSEMPSIGEMTEKAIERLSKNENGFFLMVEGSQVDWAAHDNDASAMITEYLAFDRAVQVAIDFAKENKETTVIVVSDHGNSGFTIGNRDFKNYTRRGLGDVFGAVSKYKVSARKLEKLLTDVHPTEFKRIIKEQLGIEITKKEEELLLMSKNYGGDDYMNADKSITLLSSIVKIMNERTPFGFTTGGHTGEDVLLAVYHPNGNVPMGMNTNIELNKYLCDVVGLQRPLDNLTEEIFAKHTAVFSGMKYRIEKVDDKPSLIVKNGKNELVIPAFSSAVFLNNETKIELKSTTVYIDKNDTFYVPKSLREIVDKK